MFNINLLLEIVNRNISECLHTINHFKYELLNDNLSKFHYDWYKDIIRKQRLVLFDLKEIKKFLLILKKMFTN